MNLVVNDLLYVNENKYKPMKNKFKLFMIVILITGFTVIASCVKIDLGNILGGGGNGGTSTPSPFESLVTYAATNITDSSATLNGAYCLYYTDTIKFIIFKYYIADTVGQQGLSVISSTKITENGWNNVSFNIKGLSAGTTYLYYVSNGTRQIHGGIVSFATNYPQNELFDGGIKFYVDSTGNHGLIAATNDLFYVDSTTTIYGVTGGSIQVPNDQNGQGILGIEWGDDDQFVNSTDTLIGTGQANTIAIIHSAIQYDIYAAKFCDHLELNGYSDWFLPSKDELNLLYEKRTLVGGFNPYAFYWSSSESSENSAWSQFFGEGTQIKSDKTNNFNVRLIRAF
jgi:hypothetical protein